MNNNFVRANGIPGPGNEALVFTDNAKEMMNLQAGIPYVTIDMMQPAFFQPNFAVVSEPVTGGYPIGNATDMMQVQPLMLNPNAALPPFLQG